MNKKIIIITLGIFLITLNTVIVSGCTGFKATNDSVVLVGNNEDLSLFAEPQIRITPPTGNSYGRVVFYCRWPYPFSSSPYCAFGGMNDQGLFFDIYSTPHLAQENPQNKPQFSNDIFEYCIRTCATIEEVVDVFNAYYMSYMDDIQGFFVDKYGNSVIVEGDDFVYGTGNYQIVTNFLQTHPELGGYPCWRYNTVKTMLENMAALSVDYFRDICDAAHEDDHYLTNLFILDTIYSYVCDLNEGVMYLYFFHDYNNCVEIRLSDIFEDGYQSINLASLFENDANDPPNKPDIPSGSNSGRINREYEYSIIGTDDDNDILFYQIDWGDGTDSGWIGYYNSGEVCLASHVWYEEGNFEVKVKSKDLYGRESEWSDPLNVNIPKAKSFDFIFLSKLFDLIKFRISISDVSLISFIS